MQPDLFLLLICVKEEEGFIRHSGYGVVLAGGRGGQGACQAKGTTIGTLLELRDVPDPWSLGGE